MKTNQSETETTAKGINGWFSKQVQSFEERRFAAMCVMITIQSCLGSIACMYILQNEGSTAMLMTGAAVTMGANSAFIAQAPGRWCLATFYISMVLNALIILTNL